jgi:hypothetical protein
MNNYCIEKLKFTNKNINAKVSESIFLWKNTKVNYDQNNNQVRSYIEYNSPLNNALIKVKLVVEFNGTKYSAYILKTGKDDAIDFIFNCISGPNYDNISSAQWKIVNFDGKNYGNFSMYSNDC